VTRVERAPAKINLGLEILGRREDGYHEVRTILCAISLADRLTFEDADEDAIVVQGENFDVPQEDNLVLRALRALRVRGARIPPQRVTIKKTIPAAAGLGGASSDAAATIRAFAPEIERAALEPFPIAAELGSDVPFFLDGPVALASGRGESLTPLPEPNPAWAVLLTPRIDIADKTRTMYAAVDPSWWTDGSRVGAIADGLPALPSTSPFNVFERALLARFPEMKGVRGRLLAAGAPYAALTGAGPTFYTFVESEARAREIANRIPKADETVIVARLGNDNA
jgi:4-diphosphocytidyl-2-C-methyl-D-erythritol kinase